MLKHVLCIPIQKVDTVYRDNKLIYASLIMSLLLIAYLARLRCIENVLFSLTFFTNFVHGFDLTERINLSSEHASSISMVETGTAEQR